MYLLSHKVHHFLPEKFALSWKIDGKLSLCLIATYFGETALIRPIFPSYILNKIKTVIVSYRLL